MDKEEITVLAAQQGVFPVTLHKDYVGTVLLSMISRFSEIKNMSFKGGTAIKKIYFPETRFSEDLDFTCSKDVSDQLQTMIEKAIKGGDLDINFTEIKQIDTAKNSRKFSVKYRNYNNHPDSVKIDLSLREKVIEKITNRQVVHIYSNLENGQFSIPCLSIREIMAEKVRALIYARKPRHLYDLWYLFGQNVRLDPILVREKLKFYKEGFDEQRLKGSIQDITESDWFNDLSPLVPNVPSFEDVSKSVQMKIIAAMK